MKQIILNAYDFNLKYAKQLVKDVDESMMTHTPCNGLENHPAFSLGHLVTAAALTSKYLDGPYELDSKWETLFRRKGPGDPRKPSMDVTNYPSKKELLNALSTQHNLVESLITNLDNDRFNEATKWRFQTYMPTLGDLLFFMCVSHESMHLAQVAAWRRAMNLPSALAEL